MYRTPNMQLYPGAWVRDSNIICVDDAGFTCFANETKQLFHVLFSCWLL